MKWLPGIYWVIAFVACAVFGVSADIVAITGGVATILLYLAEHTK